LADCAECRAAARRCVDDGIGGEENRAWTEAMYYWLFHTKHEPVLASSDAEEEG
jgi:hypothetical protein